MWAEYKIGINVLQKLFVLVFPMQRHNPNSIISYVQENYLKLAIFYLLISYL
jgi:hypothetical protein